MQFSAVLIMFIVKTYLNSIFTNDLNRKEIFSKNIQSYRVSSFKLILISSQQLIDHLMAGLEDVASRSSHNLMRTK